MVKFFPFTKRSGLRIFSGWGGGVGSVIFDSESKSVVKNFSLYQALWTLFFLRVGGLDIEISAQDWT